MALLDVRGTKFYVEQQGNGPPVLLVSGLRGLASHWRHQVLALGDDFTVVLHDQRGTGNSEHSRIAYSVEGLANDLLAIMDHLEIDRAHFIGHSTGAAIGQVLAQDHPDRLSSLTLISGWTAADAYFRLTFELRKQILALLGAEASERYATLFVNPPWYVNAQAAQARHVGEQPPVEVTLSRIDAILAFDRRERLHQIKLPTLVVCSRDDRLTPLYFSEALAAEIPGARLSILEDGGHSCHQTRPEALNGILKSFLIECQNELQAATKGAMK